MQHANFSSFFYQTSNQILHKSSGKDDNMGRSENEIQTRLRSIDSHAGTVQIIGHFLLFYVKLTCAVFSRHCMAPLKMFKSIPLKTIQHKHFKVIRVNLFTLVPFHLLELVITQLIRVILL